jgi:putative spermidine/putrescine transport system substrate-binding protein
MHRSTRRDGGRRGRAVLATTMLGASLALAACGDDDPAPASAGGNDGPVVAGEVAKDAFKGAQLVWSTEGGEYLDNQQAAFVDPFADQSGARVLMDPNTSDLAKLQAMIDAGNVSWDVAATFDYTALASCGTLYDKWDHDKIDLSKTGEQWIVDCFVPLDVTPIVMVYNTEEFGDNPPTKLADYFDTEQFPGKRGLEVIPGFPEPPLIEMALMADGVTPEEMYPVDFERAFDMYESLGDDLIPAPSTAALQQQLESGEVVMSLVYSGRGRTAVEENGAPFAPVWDNWTGYVEGISLPTGAKNVEASHALANFAIGTEQAEAFDRLEPTAMTNLEAEPQHEGDDWLPDRELLDQQHLPDPTYYADPKNYEEMVNAYVEWTQGS